GNDLFLETFGHRNAGEPRANGALHRVIFVQPAFKFGLLPREHQRFGKFGLLGIRRAWPIQRQNLFGFVGRHNLLSSRRWEAMSLAMRTCSWPMPREMRDF